MTVYSVTEFSSDAVLGTETHWSSLSRAMAYVDVLDSFAAVARVRVEQLSKGGPVTWSRDYVRDVRGALVCACHGAQP